MIVSMMWQVGITVITGETLRSIKFRHSDALPKADIVVIRSGGNHYILAGKSICFVCHSDLCICQSDLC